MQKRWVGLGVAVGFFLAFVILLGWKIIVPHFGGASQTLDSQAVVKEIRSLSELISVKYTVQKVVGFEEKKIPFGTEKILLIVQAEVLAGIDLSRLSPKDVEILRDRRIKITLPPPKIVHVVIDDKETKVWDRQVTWWTPWVPYNPDLERQARLAAKDSIEKAALEMGILGQAKRNAEVTIRSLLETLGVQAITTEGT